MIRCILEDTSGTSAIEYSVIAALVSVASIAAFMMLGQATEKQFQTVETAYAKAR
ncbi:Flp family type IVb pilin [Tsuneonella sp. YG55]|uniref:Flp family type IVb pilin n=1 Tax=Tsuneonella litorea TaxID=2976475 RepID=A0A9X2W1E4_9SPHN|nr:Flp family type IVb pilin [Tsuneonella litorea]MCT2558145.1 Flp family type IVb pilin [Tsuneonella litorea]